PDARRAAQVPGRHREGARPRGRAHSQSVIAGFLHFARVLRSAGLPVGTGRVLDGLRALEAVGVARREGVYWALHAVFVKRREQHDLFEQAFAAYFHVASPLEELAFLLPTIETDKAPLARRIAEALGAPAPPAPKGEPTKVEIDAVMTWSDREILGKRDFEQMSADELRRGAPGAPPGGRAGRRGPPRPRPPAPPRPRPPPRPPAP